MAVAGAQRADRPDHQRRPVPLEPGHPGGRVHRGAGHRLRADDHFLPHLPAEHHGWPDRRGREGLTRPRRPLSIGGTKPPGAITPWLRRRWRPSPRPLPPGPGGGTRSSTRSTCAASPLPATEPGWATWPGSGRGWITWLTWALTRSGSTPGIPRRWLTAAKTWP